MADEKFELVSSYQPTGDQPQAIETLVEGVQRGDRCQTLLGVTGSGKTFVHRVPVLFPQQCGGVFCQLLRLLPAGSLHPQHRYLY